MRLPTRILVPTDFSDAAAMAQEYASGLAAALGATLHVLHVIPDRPLGDGLAAREVPELIERASTEVRHRLEHWQPSAHRCEVHVVADVRTGVPDATILEYAHAHGIDLIVIGGAGHGGREPSRLGRVAVGVLRRARCPVLAVDGGSGGDRRASHSG